MKNGTRVIFYGDSYLRGERGTVVDSKDGNIIVILDTCRSARLITTEWFLELEGVPLTKRYDLDDLIRKTDACINKKFSKPDDYMVQVLEALNDLWNLRKPTSGTPAGKEAR